MQGSSRADRELLDAAALCGHLVPEGSVYAFLAEHRRRLFPDEMFEDLFSSGGGRPSVPAEVIASQDPKRIFKAVRAVMDSSKVISGKTRRALDSTVLDDAVLRQDTVDMLVTQVRRVRRLIPELVSVPVREHNLEGPGRP